jgi:hypothetical protein
MTFPTLTFSGTVSTVPGSLFTSGTFTALITGNADGSVSGSWTFDGVYSGTYDGSEHTSGTLTGTGGTSGPWTITLAGTDVINDGMTLAYASGQYTLSVAAGYGVDYRVSLGYGDYYTGHDRFDFAGHLATAGSAPSGGDTGSTAGTAGNDTINVPASGNAAIDGLGGLDTAVFGGVLANYLIAHNNDGSFTVSGVLGADTLVNVERLQFADAKVAIDINGDGGEAYRLYQAAFDRAPDLGGLGYWINVLDQGATLPQVAAAFIGSAEFTSNYGTLDNQHFVTQLYANVLHRAPDSGGLAYWQGLLDNATLTRAQVLVGFSESVENQANVIGQIQNGMVYT